MKGIKATLLKAAVKKHLENRYPGKFTKNQIDRLAQEFKEEITGEEFGKLARAGEQQRRDLVRTVFNRAAERVDREGSKEEKRLIEKLRKVRAEAKAKESARPKEA